VSATNNYYNINAINLNTNDNNCHYDHNISGTDDDADIAHHNTGTHDDNHNTDNYDHTNDDDDHITDDYHAALCFKELPL